MLAGAAELKTELVTSGLLDPRLVSLIIKSVDTSYGGENGFNQAIALSADSLANVKFTAERVSRSTTSTSRSRRRSCCRRRVAPPPPCMASTATGNILPCLCPCLCPCLPLWLCCVCSC